EQVLGHMSDQQLIRQVVHRRADRDLQHHEAGYVARVAPRGDGAPGAGERAGSQVVWNPRQNDQEGEADRLDRRIGKEERRERHENHGVTSAPPEATRGRAAGAPACAYSAWMMSTTTAIAATTHTNQTR